MHYKNGREAKNGDKVLLIPSYGSPVVGILYGATAGNDFCNGNLALVTQSDPCPSLKECLRLDDALRAIESYTPSVGPTPAAGAENAPEKAPES